MTASLSSCYNRTTIANKTITSNVCQWNINNHNTPQPKQRSSLHIKKGQSVLKQQTPKLSNRIEISLCAPIIILVSFWFDFDTNHCVCCVCVRACAYHIAIVPFSGLHKSSVLSTQRRRVSARNTQKKIDTKKKKKNNRSWIAIHSSFAVPCARTSIPACQRCLLVDTSFSWRQHDFFFSVLPTRLWVACFFSRLFWWIGLCRRQD